MSFLKNLFGKNEPPEKQNPTHIQSRLGPLDVSWLQPAEAMAAWKGHAQGYSQTGLWPVLVGTPETVERFAELDIGEAGTFEEVVQMASTVNVSEFLSTRLRDQLGFEENAFPDDYEGFDVRELAVPKEISESSTAIDGLGGDQPELVGLVLVPCKAPYEVFAALPFGGWNDCPNDHEHFAVMKRWFEKYRATPFSLQSDVIELYLENPILDVEAAAKVAREFYEYAPDIVDQGTETLKAAAQETLGNRVWFFWWD